MLVLMVRNEAKIISRCLVSALPFVDAILLADTGSTDDTVEVVEARLAGSHKAWKVVAYEWHDFGESRTASMRAARVFGSELRWEMSTSYALALDADMLMCGDPDVIRAQLAESKPSGASVKQVNGNLDYYNVRLMRLADEWWCEGCTHEHWTGGGVTSELPQGVAWIEDRDDGGCKADKLERDKGLLLAGLAKQPECVRYMFYLAQTYRCLGEDEQAIIWYQRRIEAGGWVEEIWYSLLMMAHIKLKSKDTFEAERLVDKGLALQGDRIEGVLSLISHFREASQHFKAWHYLKVAEGMKMPSDARLFLERDAYGHKLDYERSILHWYVCPQERAQGALHCLHYEGPDEASVLQNLTCYAVEAPAHYWLRLQFPTPAGFSSGSVAINEARTLFVRTVSYHINDEGLYLMKDNRIETRNFSAQWNAEERSWTGWAELELDASSLDRWRRPDSIRGLEDIRVRGDYFTATTREYSYCAANRIVHGLIPKMTFAPVAPPHGETYCEKNWLPTADGRVIHQWHPFTLGRIIGAKDEASKLQVELEHQTPRWFRHLRGSAPPLELEDGLWVLTHVVCPRSPRHYLHLWVVLEKETFVPLMHSPPFIFRHRGIEYSIGTTAASDEKSLGLFVSVWDRESWYCEVSLTDLRRSLLKV